MSIGLFAFTRGVQPLHLSRQLFGVFGNLLHSPRSTLIWRRRHVKRALLLLQLRRAICCASASRLKAARSSHFSGGSGLHACAICSERGANQELINSYEYHYVAVNFKLGALYLGKLCDGGIGELYPLTGGSDLRICYLPGCCRVLPGAEITRESESRRNQPRRGVNISAFVQGLLPTRKECRFARLRDKRVDVLSL